MRRKTLQNFDEAPDLKTARHSYRNPLALRLSALAEVMDLSVDYLRKEIRAGRLRAHKAGSVWIVSVDDARAWLDGLPSNQAQGSQTVVSATA